MATPHIKDTLDSSARKVMGILRHEPTWNRKNPQIEQADRRSLATSSRRFEELRLYCPILSCYEQVVVRVGFPTKVRVQVLISFLYSLLFELLMISLSLSIRHLQKRLLAKRYLQVLTAHFLRYLAAQHALSMITYRTSTSRFWKTSKGYMLYLIQEFFKHRVCVRDSFPR